MKKIIFIALIFLSAQIFSQKLFVVTTLTTYANIAKQIGKDKIEVTAIVKGNQDAHFVRPKPSYAELLAKADLFISTGLDLELWVPSLVDMSKNPRIRSGQPGFVAASRGIELLEKPDVLSRSEGGLHIYGNPHITTNPLNYKVIAENIEIGLEKNDPENAEFYRKNLEEFNKKIDEKTFGKDLLNLLGSKILTKLANKGKLIPFLENNSYNGKKLISYLGGWLKEAMPFRGTKVVTYHKNWTYFVKLFGLEIVNNIEPKPGIPPSPKHVEELIQEMKKDKIRIVIAANYFDENKVKSICDKVGAVPVILPIYVNGAEGTDDVFKLTDYWIEHLNKAYEKAYGANKK